MKTLRLKQEMAKVHDCYKNNLSIDAKPYLNVLEEKTSRVIDARRVLLELYRVMEYFIRSPDLV